MAYNMVFLQYPILYNDIHGIIISLMAFFPRPFALRFRLVEQHRGRPALCGGPGAVSAARRRRNAATKTLGE